MSISNLDDLENAVDRLIAALTKERSRKKEFQMRIAELEARMEKEPAEMDVLRKENARLKRNCAVAADKVEELLKSLEAQR